VPLAAVVDKALYECRAQSPRPQYQPAADDIWVQADSEQLATVLGHVLRNAQDATQADGHVTLRVKRESSHATIEIEDDGAGMDEDFIRNGLFKPFFTTKASKGMGIGAYQARAYVHSLGGTMDVSSTPGQGSVFTIRLPLAKATDSAAAADNAQAAP
jgi:signal transduction histidine kinase